MTATPQTDDSSLRFLFDDADIRGEWVGIDAALSKMAEPHAYSHTVKALLGEFAAAVVLISNNLKYTGKITLQAQTPGALSLVMVECTSDAEIRGIARGDIAVEAADPFSLMADGQLAITIERQGGQRYQGIVALDGHNLAEALDGYFLQSEQLTTRFWLCSDGHRARGMMLQQLPPQRVSAGPERQDQWQTVEALAATLTPEELLSVPASTLLHRLFHELPYQQFAAQSVIFRCSCSRERSLNALSCLPPSEIAEMLAEQPEVTLTCEMCNNLYKFSQDELNGLAEPPILH